MEIRISQSTKDRTESCPWNFACLNGDCDHKPCKGRYADGPDVLFIEAQPIECPYKVPSGFSHVCTCPTRYELFVRYHK